MQTLRSFLGLVKHFSHLPGMWAHLSSPLGHQPHGHRDAGPPCPRPVAHLPCLLGTAQGGLSPGPEQVVTRTTQNKPGPHLGHPPLNSLAGQDLGTVTGRPDNPLREPPDKSQVKSTELPGGGGRLEFTPPPRPPREQTKNALLGCRPLGVRFPSCAIQCHTGTRGWFSPPWPTRELWAPRGWQRRSLAEPPQLGHGPSAPTRHLHLPPPSACTCPSGAVWTGAGPQGPRGTGRWALAVGASPVSAHGPQGASGASPPASGLLWGGWWGGADRLGIPLCWELQLASVEMSEAVTSAGRGLGPDLPPLLKLLVRHGPCSGSSVCLSGSGAVVPTAPPHPDARGRRLRSGPGQVWPRGQ